MMKQHLCCSLLLGLNVLFLHAEPGSTPIPPIAKAGPSKLLLGDTEGLLEGSASDPDTDTKKFPLKIVWNQISGPSQAQFPQPSNVRATVKGLVPGSYVFRLSVTDSTQLTSTEDVTFTVRTPPAPGLEIPANDPQLQYRGRNSAPNPEVRELGFSGASVFARFTGTSLRVRLKAGWGPPCQFWAILDGRADKAVLLYVDNRSEQLVSEGLTEGEHSLELVRLSGGWGAIGEFRGLVLDKDAKLLAPPERPARRIEFYGDSITEGTAWPDPPGSNAYGAYAMTTGRLLNADTSLIAKSGMGLVRGFTLPQTLPGFVERATPGQAKWDFALWTPHVVVINIGQNDAWTWGGRNPDEFVDAYVALLKTLRGHYPKALLIAALGSMDAVAPNSPWPARVEAAVKKFKEQSGDVNTETFLFDYAGGKGHPSPAKAKEMAEKLSAYITAKGDAIWQN